MTMLCGLETPSHYLKQRWLITRKPCSIHLRTSSYWRIPHYNDVIMSAVAYQITSLTIAYSTDHSDADQRKHQSSASLAFVRGIHRGPVNSPHKWPVTRKMFPFDDVIMKYEGCTIYRVYFGDQNTTGMKSVFVRWMDLRSVEKTDTWFRVLY